MFHSTPKLIHISSRFEDDDPLRRKSQFGIDWRHVCLLESLQQAEEGWLLCVVYCLYVRCVNVVLTWSVLVLLKCD